jgi:hypothetical protein
LSFLNGVQGISIVGLSLLVEGFLGLSLGINDSEVLFVLEGSLFIDFQVVGDSDFLGLASVQLSLGVSEDGGGVSDLSSSEFEFGGTFGLFDVVDFVVLDLFGVDGVSEFAQDVEDGIKGGLSLDFGFNFHHDGHD